MNCLTQVYPAQSLNEYIDDLNVASNQQPSGFRCRMRVGRGNRLVIDRIPVSLANYTKF